MIYLNNQHPPFDNDNVFDLSTWGFWYWWMAGRSSQNQHQDFTISFTCASMNLSPIFVMISLNSLTCTIFYHIHSNQMFCYSEHFEHDLHLHVFFRLGTMQGTVNWQASSYRDFIQNYFLLKRMFDFFDNWDKCRKPGFFRGNIYTSCIYMVLLDHFANKSNTFQHSLSPSVSLSLSLPLPFPPWVSTSSNPIFQDCSIKGTLAQFKKISSSFYY